jgi:type IV pilus assembly protein PilQ
MTIFRLKHLAKSLVLVVFMGGLWAVSFAAQVAPDFDFYSNELIAKESYRKISMDFRDASMKDILKIFSEQSGLNFIASDKVKDRTVTLYLDQVPLQEALDKIVRANNLVYDLDPGSNVFIVRESGRPDVEIATRVYYLKYSRSKDSKLQKAIDSGAGSSSSAAGGAASGAGGGASPGASSGGSGGIEDSIKSVLSKAGSVVFDGRTNSIIVSDIPTQFDVIERVIAILDTPTPQVMIEVEMLDVAKDVVDKIGVDFGSGQLIKYTGSDVSTNTPSFLFNSKLPALTDMGGVNSEGAGFQYGTISTSVFTALLDYLTTDTKTKVLARPRILTLSNESASIEIAIQSETIGIKVEKDNTTGITTTSAERSPVPTGISLKVTPQVDSVTQNVTMYIEPTVAESKPALVGGGFRDVEQRTSKTTLMVKNGETIVVGGLIKDKDSTTIRKMPILGDLPIIGMAFRHKDKTVNERELIVFLTPRIVGYENSATLAKGNAAFPEATGTVAYREQATPVARKEEVDNMLERWEN